MSEMLTSSKSMYNGFINGVGDKAPIGVFRKDSRLTLTIILNNVNFHRRGWRPVGFLSVRIKVFPFGCRCFI